ncbi:hypothetical protein LCGC14_0922950 [marine sediment metagenome]|uniref:Uncharacterized protein n=1 Tax=marine sediment metagenome TaxID=412755 RepID=A0A0F9PAW0_9ZZZZ
MFVHCGGRGDFNFRESEDKMLTRKDFKAIVKIIKNNTVNKTTKRIIDRGGFTKDIADYLTTQNPRFDRQKFLAACED